MEKVNHNAFLNVNKTHSLLWSTYMFVWSFEIFVRYSSCYTPALPQLLSTGDLSVLDSPVVGVIVVDSHLVYYFLVSAIYLSARSRISFFIIDEENNILDSTTFSLTTIHWRTLRVFLFPTLSSYSNIEAMDKDGQYLRLGCHIFWAYTQKGYSCIIYVCMWCYMYICMYTSLFHPKNLILIFTSKCASHPSRKTLLPAAERDHYRNPQLVKVYQINGHRTTPT